jgi:5-formyltetrahydrofolate cyclo-ligase
MDGSAAKRALRTAAEAARRTLHEASPDAGLEIADRYFSALPPRQGQTVAGYIPTRNEADPAPLMAALRESGCHIALPRVVAKGFPLAFHAWDEDAVPVAGALNLLEPAPHWPNVTPDIVLVPLLAFDPGGHRLGYGGGYYDRTLRTLRAAGQVLAVGISFAGQEIAEVPARAGDEKLDWIVTEKGARRF